MSENTSSNRTGAPERPVGREEVVATAIKAASELFAEHNPSQVSVREIARHAGVSHALVHRYLGSKEDIFRAVVASEEQHAQEFWASQKDVATAPSVFGAGLVSDRYLRILLRAYMEGIEVEPRQAPLSGRVLDLLAKHPVKVPADEPGYDARIVLLAATAAIASMSLAEDFFVAGAGLKEMDPDDLHAEYHRLMLHILSLARPTA